jgi:hypothetical protein
VILRALLTRKALDLDDILNKILKILALEISKGLTYIVSKLLAGDIMLIRFQELITLTLYKEDKKDYSLLGSYRLIALENTLTKVIEKVLTNRLSLTTEEHSLVP